jgi:hypothetical protein
MTIAVAICQIEHAEKTKNYAALTRVITDVFSSVTLVNGSFLSNSASRLDVMGLESVFCNLIKLGDTGLLQRMMNAFSTGLTELLKSVSELTDADSLRCVLAYWQCPLNSNTALSREPFQKLCDTIVRLPTESRQQILRWVREDYPSHIFAARLLKPLHQHMAYHLGVEFGRGRAVPTLTYIMSYLYDVNELSPGAIIPFTQFYDETISALEDQPLLHDYRSWRVSREVRGGVVVGVGCGWGLMGVLGVLILTGAQVLLLRLPVLVERRGQAAAAQPGGARGAAGGGAKGYAAADHARVIERVAVSDPDGGALAPPADDADAGRAHGPDDAQEGAQGDLRGGGGGG